MPGSLDTRLAPRSRVHGVPFSLPHSCLCSDASPAGCQQLRLSCPWSGCTAALCPVDDDRVWTRLQLTLWLGPDADCPIIGREKLETLSPVPFSFSNEEIWPWASLCHILLADPFMYYGFCSLVPKMRTQRV